MKITETQKLILAFFLARKDGVETPYMDKQIEYNDSRDHRNAWAGLHSRLSEAYLSLAANGYITYTDEAAEKYDWLNGEDKEEARVKQTYCLGANFWHDQKGRTISKKGIEACKEFINHRSGDAYFFHIGCVCMESTMSPIRGDKHVGTHD